MLLTKKKVMFTPKHPRRDDEGVSGQSKAVKR